jgi:hypothetical protein
MTEAQADQIIELMQYLPAIWLVGKQIVFWMVTADALIDQANRGILNY